MKIKKQDRKDMQEALRHLQRASEILMDIEKEYEGLSSAWDSADNAACEVKALLEAA